MTSHPGKNEGFRILDEFVCQAIPDASALAGEATRPAGGVGENEGMQIMAEAASRAPGEPGPEKDSAAESRTERPGGEGAAVLKPYLSKLYDSISLSAPQLRGLLRFVAESSVEDLRLIHEVVAERLAAAGAEPTDEEMESIIESILSSQ